MRKLNYILIFLLCIFGGYARAEALNIEYGTPLDVKGTSLLVQYYGINTTHNYLCSITTLACSTTKKSTLGLATGPTLPSAIAQELKDKKVEHITLSPSANFVAYYQQGSTTTPRIYTIRNIKTGAEYTTTDPVSYWDLIDDQGKVFAFSPNESKLVYIDDKDGNFSLYSVDTHTLANGAITSTKISTQAFQVDDFIFTDANTLYYIGNTKENPYDWSLHKYDMKTMKDTKITGGLSYVDPLIKIGSSIVFTSLQAQGYGPALYNTVTKKVRAFSIPTINTTSMITHQSVVHIGAQTAVVMTPDKIDSKKTYPVVIWLHGGPYRQTSYGYHPYHSYGIYDAMLNLLRKDAIVVKLDYRGSLGHGSDYSSSLKDTVGVGDVNDVMDAVSYVKTKYHTKGIYLSGNSYGGYLSLKTVVEHPEAITSVLSINGVTDWDSLLTQMQTSIFNTDFGGAPNPGNQALYDQASIINKINNLGTQKIEIVQGQSDRTIPPWQAELLYNDLVKANKNVSIVRYAGEDHVFKYKKNISNLCVQMFNFIGAKADPQCTT